MLHTGRIGRLRAVLGGAALGWLCALSVPVLAASEPTPAEVGQAIALHRARVAEFQVIKAAAEDLGLRVWLFGGTAAGFAHYVRWDLAREGGDPRYRQSFFDYDFTNIYRSTQDADLVVDGTPEQAAALERLIKEKLAFLQGSKDHWEVRLLREDRVAPGGQVKQALLANPDFLEQNTDSNSTGMIELTDPPAGESVVRDLRDWESPEPVFLQDVTAGRLHYYWSESHRTTSRYRSGDNPEIFSVLRYLVKAFQYDLKVEGEDLARIRAIIEAFDLEREDPPLSEWAKGWLERYGPNLIRHSVNVEYAWNTLQGLGLREKLISLSKPEEQGTLGWWLSREPLRTRPLGEGEGKTARELGIDRVAHETRDFLAYESITRDTTGRPNVLISRPDQPGEAALFGPGFYTLLGRKGAAGTGLTIRFRLDPRAREGSDFIRPTGDLVLVTNRAALQVIPESLEASLLEYFQLLRSGLIDDSDRGAWMKLKRRLLIKPAAPGEEEEIRAIVAEAIEKVGEQIPWVLLREWFSLPQALKHPELVQALLDHLRAGSGSTSSLDYLLVTEVLSRPEWSDHPELVRPLIGRSGPVNDQIVQSILAQPGWSRYPELAEAILADGRVTNVMARRVFSGPLWKDHPQLAESLQAKATHDRLHSPEARRVAFQELAFALVNDPLVSGVDGPVRVRQAHQPDGTFSYSRDLLPRPVPIAKPLPGRKAALTLMAAFQARLLAATRAGYAVPRWEAVMDEIERIGREYLSREAPDGTVNERTLREMVGESQAVARDRLDAHWPALERAVDALLHRETEVRSREEIARIVFAPGAQINHPGVLLDHLVRSETSVAWDGLIQELQALGREGRDCP